MTCCATVAAFSMPPSLPSPSCHHSTCRRGTLLSATMLSFLLPPPSLSYCHHPLHPPSHCHLLHSHAHCACMAPQNFRDPTQPWSATVRHPHCVLSLPTLPPCHPTCPRLSMDHLHPSHGTHSPSCCCHPLLSAAPMLSLLLPPPSLSCCCCLSAAKGAGFDNCSLPMVWPTPFGCSLTKEESYIQKLDSSTSMSLKLTVLNPEGLLGCHCHAWLHT